MSSGPQRAEAQQQDGLTADDLSLQDIGQEPPFRLPRWQEERQETPATHLSYDDDETYELEEPIAPHSDGLRRTPRLVAALIVLLALAWLGAAGWALAQAPRLQDPLWVLNGVALMSTPLILLGIAWLILGHSPRRETQRFTRAVEQMRVESQALESVLEIVAGKLEENHARLTNEAAKLMTLGDEASDRLGRVTHFLAKEARNLDSQAEALETAAANARVDIGVLLHDLPRAEEQARTMAGALRETGLAAHEQAGSLEGQLAALTARGREADEVVGGAAQRLGAHLARVESTTAAATEKLDEATIGMTAAIDGAMARAAEAIDQARTGLDTQGTAMLATVEQSRAALAEAGDEAARNLAQRLERIGRRVEDLGRRLAEQDEAAETLVARLDGELSGLETRIGTLRDAGVAGADQMSDSFAVLRSLAEALRAELGSDSERTDALVDRMGQLSRGFAELHTQLEGQLPAALAEVEAHAERTRAAASGIVPEVRAVETSAEASLARLGEAEQSVGRQRAALDAMAAKLAEELVDIERRVAAIRDSGAEGGDGLNQAFAALGPAAEQLLRDLAGGQDRADGLRRSLQSLGEEFEAPVADALARVEEQATRTHDRIGAIVPTVAQVQSSTHQATTSAEALVALLGSGADERLRALAAAASEAEAAAAKLTRDTGPELIEALLRVRDASAQASQRAREAIAEAIPESAALLAEASRKAVAEAVSLPVEQQMAEMVKVTAAAVEAARLASERLTRQLLTIGETAAAIEGRIEDARRDDEEREGESLSHHVTLLTESLNSAAIDVTKILSNEVTDAAWTAYLKGDRGVFTRRAVRLLSNTETREILRHYDEEPDFREHVNRYIHDFEAMMRRILAEREGAALGVTILSSDMGKLYVALAQAIERLRR